MRTVGRILGWAVTIAFIVLVAVLLVVEEFAKTWLTDVIDMPDWVAWLILAALAVGLSSVIVAGVLSPKARAHRRAERERRRRLSRFELD